jgi:hypothetical protein
MDARWRDVAHTVAKLPEMGELAQFLPRTATRPP